MLKQRVVTGLLLLVLMLGMLFFAPQGLWAAFTAVIALLVLREFGRLFAFSIQMMTAYLAVSGLLGGLFYLSLFSSGQPWAMAASLSSLWACMAILVMLFWIVGVPLWLCRKWHLRNPWVAMLLGWLLLFPFWIVLLVTRGEDSQNALTLLLLMGLVWIADISAYAFGRLFGKRKLAPAISPGKSWEGAAGGLACVLCYVAVLLSAGYLKWNYPWPVVLAATVILVAASIIGDLFESWLKRCAGVKDSSRLLPGHGGVFDRVDSLIAVFGVLLSASVLLEVWRG